MNERNARQWLREMGRSDDEIEQAISEGQDEERRRRDEETHEGEVDNEPD